MFWHGLTEALQSSSALTQPIYSASHLHNPHSSVSPSNEKDEVESKETGTHKAIIRVEIVSKEKGKPLFPLWRKGAV